jgi:type VI secretion system secreted protein VgrG
MENRVTARIMTSALNDVVLVELLGRESMNELPRFEALVAVKPFDGDLTTLLMAPFTVVFEDALEGSHRTIPLVATEVEAVEKARGLREVLAVTLEPACAVFRESGGYRVFVQKTTKQIVDALFAQNGLASLIEWRLTGSYGVRPQCNQYDETDLSFFERLLADEGWSYWYDPDGSTPRLVIGDTISSCEGIVEPNVVPYADESGMVAVRHFDRFALSDEVPCAKAMLRNHDHRRPLKPIDGVAEGPGAGFYFEYPARVTSDAEAKSKAAARLEQLARWSRRADARSDVHRLAAGRRVVVDGCEDADMNGKYTVVEVAHSYVREDGGTRYFNEVAMVPEPLFFRPSPPCWPAIPSLEPAVTTGPGGEEIHVDDMGSVTLRMPWDRSGITDDKSSWWMRTAQMNLSGIQLLPRMGWEVPVMYWRGDPDRAVVLGRFFNGQTPLPHGMPGAKATTNFGSATTPGGGTSNAITMGDTAGGQGYSVNASKDHTHWVGGARTTHISGNLDHSIGQSLRVGIKGDQTTTVGADQNVDVGTESATVVNGSRTVLVGGLEQGKVKGNRSVTTSPYSESVGALHGILCNQHNSEVLGDFLQNVGAAAALQAGIGSGETVLGARAHHVGGALTYTVGKYMEAGIGPKSVTSGATSVNAGAEVATHANVGTLSCGSMTVSASGDVVVTASGDLTVDVSGNITTPGGVIGGGQIKITSGTEKLDGDTKRNSATVIVQG